MNLRVDIGNPYLLVPLITSVSDHYLLLDLGMQTPTIIFPPMSRTLMIMFGVVSCLIVKKVGGGCSCCCCYLCSHKLTQIGHIYVHNEIHSVNGELVDTISAKIEKVNLKCVQGKAREGILFLPCTVDASLSRPISSNREHSLHINVCSTL